MSATSNSRRVRVIYGPFNQAISTTATDDQIFNTMKGTYPELSNAGYSVSEGNNEVSMTITLNAGRKG
jgi:hypothetical protein